MLSLCALAIAVIIFLIALVVFCNRISMHAIHGQGFYDYNKTTTYEQRRLLDAGTERRPWMFKHESELQCAPAKCS